MQILIRHTLASELISFNSWAH